MKDYPVSIARVERILAANTLATASITSLCDVIDDQDLQGILGRLSVINTRMGLLVACHDVQELREVGEMINPAIEERFFNASEEYLYQIDNFITRARGVQNVQA